MGRASRVAKIWFLTFNLIINSGLNWSWDCLCFFGFWVIRSYERNCRFLFHYRYSVFIHFRNELDLKEKAVANQEMIPEEFFSV